MSEIFLAEKIEKIYPNAQFYISDNSIENLVFIEPKDLPIPSDDQLKAAELLVIEDRKKNIQNKIDAEAKLAALGLTPDDLKALGLA